MSEYNIFRPLSNVEKNEIVELGTTNALNLFLKDVANVQLKYQKLYLPFDSYGARVDFDEIIKRKSLEFSSTIDVTKINSKIDFGDFSQYAKPELFDFTGSMDMVVIKLIAGIKNEVMIGKRYLFVTKQRGNKISIAVPNEDVKKMDEYVNKTYLNKSETVKKE